jgi:flavin reductase (DIM6/NTAB) family NADH-FMN oxidoreductase RutF
VVEEHSMVKQSAGTNVAICPMPVTLVGSIVNGRPNFMAVGWIARVNMSPPLVSLGLNHGSATRTAILEKKEFSLNFPSSKMVCETDYCGLTSGKNTDKSKLFTVFYGGSQQAPMITECPLSLECRFVESHDYASHTCIIGEIIGSYIDESCLTDGKPDQNKIDPLLLTMPDNTYWRIGENVGKAWHEGKSLINKI